jgi:NADH dehydrogenase
MHVMVTGAGGYIGERLITTMLDRGWHITVLGRPAIDPTTSAQLRLRRYEWRLGANVPEPSFSTDKSFQHITAIVHLAHDWAGGTGAIDEKNVRDTCKLLNTSRAHGVRRFVFISSLSARPDALNRYGRTKAAIEDCLTGPGEVAARVGLVYGGRRRSMYATLCRITDVSPIIPILDADQAVQPIHIDDVCAGIIALVERPALTRKIYGLGDPHPVTFGDFLRALARHRRGRRLRLIPISRRAALFLADLTARVTFLPKIDRERILGLGGIRVRDTMGDIEELGIAIRPLDEGLAAETLRRRLCAEARTLLHYSLGGEPHLSTVKLYVRSLEQLGTRQAISIPALVARYPSMLRFADPHGTMLASDLDRRLGMAMRIAEASLENPALFHLGQAGPTLAALRLLRTLTAEILLWPLRRVRRRRCR